MTEPDRRTLDRLQRRLRYRFADPELLATALTHRSAAHETGGEHYERLEFLGDAVIGLVTARWLYEEFPDSPEGRLAKLKSHLVSAEALEQLALELELCGCLRLGAGEERSGGRHKRSLLADSIEAVVGALFLDAGLTQVRALLCPWLARCLESQEEDLDSKTRLQELLQAGGGVPPTYRVVSSEGPDHRRLFRVECLRGNEVLADGDGNSKKLAEQAAARRALELLGA